MSSEYENLNKWIDKILGSKVVYWEYTFGGREIKVVKFRYFNP